MTALRLQAGEPVPRVDDKTPGYGWRLSDRAKRDIEAIEENAHRALRMIGDWPWR